MINNILEIDSVQKQFGERNILSDVSLRCETGDVIGLLGKNGSGKSTLLKIIFGIVPANHKFIRLNGIVKTKTRQMHKEISYLHQENFIPTHFSVKKVIALSIEKNKIHNFQEEDEVIKSILCKKIKILSGGELRYLEIKIVLSNESKFVLLDEPYTGLSPIWIDKINFLIAKNSIKKGIIITDHNYENVIRISNKLMLMVDGGIHHLKNKSELIDKGYLSKGML